MSFKFFFTKVVTQYFTLGAQIIPALTTGSLSVGSCVLLTSCFVVFHWSTSYFLQYKMLWAHLVYFLFLS